VYAQMSEDGMKIHSFIAMVKVAVSLYIKPAMELCKYPQVLGFVENASHRNEPHECVVNCAQIVMELSKGQTPIVGLTLCVRCTSPKSVLATFLPWNLLS
jgi:hypothetical protein